MKVTLNNDKRVKVYTSIQFQYVKTKQLRKFSFKKPCTYMDRAIYLDTETSHVGEDIAWIYQWAFEFYGQYIIGRNAEQLSKALKRITDIYHLDHEHRVICYIHNLSYDIVYMIDWLRREYDEEPEILAVDRHKVLTCYIGGIEFRCSYLLSNMSLDAWSKKLNTSTRKMVGAIDYSDIKYPDDTLTQVDWEYQINDVQTLKECVEMELRGSGDTLATIPLTSTGYVRRDLRIACKNMIHTGIISKNPT